MSLIDRPAGSKAPESPTDAGAPDSGTTLTEIIFPLAREQAPAGNGRGGGTDAKPRTRRFRSWRLWRGRFAFLLLIIGCVALGARQIWVHDQHANRFALQRVTLTADPVAVLSDVSGVVYTVTAKPGQLVKRGDVLAIVQVPATNPKTGATARSISHTLLAPTAGSVSDVTLQPGSSLRIGDVAVRLYQPDQLYFRVSVSSDRLPDLAVGMTGPMRAGKLGPIQVRLLRIEPVLNGDAGDQGTSTLVLEPINPASVEPLVPGLVFQGWLDKRSGHSQSLGAAQGH